MVRRRRIEQWQAYINGSDDPAFDCPDEAASAAASYASIVAEPISSAQHAQDVLRMTLTYLDVDLDDDTAVAEAARNLLSFLR